MLPVDHDWVFNCALLDAVRTVGGNGQPARAGSLLLEVPPWDVPSPNWDTFIETLGNRLNRRDPRWHAPSKRVLGDPAREVWVVQGPSRAYALEVLADDGAGALRRIVRWS